MEDEMASHLIPGKAEVNTQLLAEMILQQSDAPPCAIINDACDIIYIHGRTGRYLEPPEGKTSINIVEMARQGLKADLASAIRQVTIHIIRKWFLTDLTVQQDDGNVYLNLTVRPIMEISSMHGLMLVLFDETPAPSARQKGEPQKRGTTSNDLPEKTVEELEQELLHTRENLQTTIEELQTSNEELKSANEELQSTNEEQQSTNEELETSKEELQSLNEESVTVNAELQSRIDEFSKAGDDMKNLLDSTEIATLFLDADLCIRRFTPRAIDIIPLTAKRYRPTDQAISPPRSIDINLMKYAEHGSRGSGST